MQNENESVTTFEDELPELSPPFREEERSERYSVATMLLGAMLGVCVLAGIAYIYCETEASHEVWQTSWDTFKLLAVAVAGYYFGTKK